MHSDTVSAPAEVVAAFDALDAAVDAIADLDLDALPPLVRLRVLERLETSSRRQSAVGHDVIAGLDKEEPAQLGGVLHQVLADRLRISRADARRRVRSAAQLVARLTPTGAELAPQLPATAKAWHDGLLSEHHLRVIQQFMRDLPAVTPPDTAEEAEAFLAEHATQLRPDQLEKLAARYAIEINPDGKYTDTDRSRQRGFTWSPQRRDGMSIGKLTATPELRANLDAWLAKFAAPGVCNPDDETPCVTDEPTEDGKRSDHRSHAQRQHDALNALVRSQLGDPKLGTHHGLPVTVIVSTTLKELTRDAGYAVTGGGTLLPMRDVIRMASHAYHYLAVFDDHQRRPLYLGRTRRIASPDQRVVLYARDRGCTRPGCDTPAYFTEVHHMNPWSQGGSTDIDDMTLACHRDHKLNDEGWHTRMRPDGRVEWIPPPQRGLSPAINDFHHPERRLPNGPPGVGESDDPPDADTG